MGYKSISKRSIAQIFSQKRTRNPTHSHQIIIWNDSQLTFFLLGLTKWTIISFKNSIHKTTPNATHLITDWINLLEVLSTFIYILNGQFYLKNRMGPMTPIQPTTVVLFPFQSRGKDYLVEDSSTKLSDSLVDEISIS